MEGIPQLNNLDFWRNFPSASADDIFRRAPEEISLHKSRFKNLFMYASNNYLDLYVRTLNGSRISMTIFEPNYKELEIFCDSLLDMKKKFGKGNLRYDVGYTRRKNYGLSELNYVRINLEDEILKEQLF